MDSTRQEPPSPGILDGTATCIGWGLFILLYGVESHALGFAGRPWPFARPGAQDGGLVLAGLGVVCFASSLLLGGFLDAWTRYEAPAPWLRRLRFILALVPLLGLYLFPFWTWLREAKPAWAFVEPGQWPESRALTGAVRFSRGWILRLSSVLVFSLVAVHTIALQALLAWLLAPDWPVDVRLRTLAGLRIALRATGFLATILPNLFLYRWKLISPRAFLLAMLFCLAWLTPWPFFGLALVSGFRGLGRKKKQLLLSTIAWAGRNRLSQRLESGGGMDWWKSSHWRRWRLDPQTRRTRTMEARLTLLYRMKTFLLLLDTAALVLALGWLARSRPALETGMARIERLAILVSRALPDALVFLLPLLFFLIARGAEALRRSEAPDALLPWRYLFLALAAVLVGLEQSLLLLGGRHLDLAASLLQVGFAAGTSVFLLNLPFQLNSVPRSETLSSLMSWTSLLLGMSWAGQLILENEALDRAVTGVLKLCALLSPVWALAAALAWGRSLLDPFQPRDVLSARLAPRSRILLASLLLSSVLPFGGLATPFWKNLRSRLWDLHAGTT